MKYTDVLMNRHICTQHEVILKTSKTKMNELKPNWKYSKQHSTLKFCCMSLKCSWLTRLGIYFVIKAWYKHLKHLFKPKKKTVVAVFF